LLISPILEKQKINKKQSKNLNNLLELSASVLGREEILEGTAGP
jgi:hypothetical protein